MRIALARILLLDPDVLLMDEPTNHLDLESIVWLEEWLATFKGDLVMTSHDREFMTRICGRTVEVDGGAITTYAGDYDFYVKERALRREQLIASQKRQAAMLAKEEVLHRPVRRAGLPRGAGAVPREDHGEDRADRDPAGSRRR